MKRKIVLTLAFTFLIFFVVEPAMASMGGGGMGGGGGQQMGGDNSQQGGEGGRQQMGSWGRASDMMDYGRSMRAGQGMYGMGFMYSAGNAYGSYVTFIIDNQTGNILNYGVMGNSLFNISIENFNYKSTSSQGSITWVSNSDGSTIIQLHDNPAAVINILTSKGRSVTFTLADGVNATKEDNFVRIESGGIVGYIVGNGTVTSSVSGTQVKLDALPNGAVVFRAAPINMPMFNHMDREFSQEIARNRMGMEIALGRNGTYDSINYSTMMHMGVQAMERNRIRLLVNSTEPSGRIIAINLDNTSLIVGAHDKLRIDYDGQPINCVNDPNIVFNGTDRPLCWMSPIQEGVRAQLMIYVPHFSEHTIDIVVEPEVTGTPAATQTVSPAITNVKPATPKAPGFGLIVSLFGFLTWAFLRRRNK